MNEIQIPAFEFELLTSDSLIEKAGSLADHITIAAQLPESVSKSAITELLQEATILEVAMLQVTQTMNKNTKVGIWRENPTASQTEDDEIFQELERMLNGVAQYLNILQAVGIDVQKVKASSIKTPELEGLLTTLSNTVLSIQKVLFTKPDTTEQISDPWEN